jgi:hypothetical protein
MKFCSGGLIILLLLILTAIIGAGCKKLFRDAKPPAKIKIADNKQLSQNWLEIIPPAPLEATAKIHVVALKIQNVKGWADEDKLKLRLADGSDVMIEVELIDDKGSAIPLFPNGFGEYVEFGKRAANKENPEEYYFQKGQKFSKIRLRSDKPVTAEEIVWTEFEF